MSSLCGAAIVILCLAPTGLVSNFYSGITPFSMYLMWTPPGVHCDKRNINYTYQVQCVYDKKLVSFRVPRPYIQLNKLRPNQTIHFTVQTICPCGKFGLPASVQGTSKFWHEVTKFTVTHEDY